MKLSDTFGVVVLEYLLMLFIILEFNTAYMYFPIVGNIIRNAAFFPLIFLLILKNESIKNCPIVLAYIVGSLVLLFNVETGELLSYIKTYMLFVPLMAIYLMWLYRENRTNSLLIAFSNIMLVEAIVSLFFGVAGTNLNIIQPTGNVLNEWGSYIHFIPSYHGIYFETQEVSYGIRNSGMFNEGPMHNMALCVAFAIAWFVNPRKSYIKSFIFVLAILSTFTTTGLLFLVVSLFISLSSRVYAKKWLFLLLTPIAIILFYQIAVQTIDNKLYREDTGEISVMSRQQDIKRCIEVGFENPIIGVSIYRTNNSRIGYVASKSQYGYSNSLFKAFAHGGLYLMILYVGLFLILPLWRFSNKEDRPWASLVLVFFFLFTITSALYKLITFFFIAFCLSKIGISKKEKIITKLLEKKL